MMVNVAEVAPAGTVTVDGTVATLVLAEESDTTAPPIGAAADNVTVPVDVLPAATVVGEMVNALKFGTTTFPIWICHSPRP